MLHLEAHDDVTRLALTSVASRLSGFGVSAQVVSLRRVAAMRPRRFFDAHRGLLPDVIAMLSAKADWIEEMISAIDDRARRGWDEVAIRRSFNSRRSTRVNSSWFVHS